MTTNSTRNSLLQPRASVVALGLALAFPGMADAASSSAGEEYLSTTEAAPPNILFLVDMDSTMGDPCPGGGSDTGDTAAGSFSNPCIEDVANAIDLVTQHFDFARYGIIGTSDESTYGGRTLERKTRNLFEEKSLRDVWQGRGRLHRAFWTR